MTQLCSFQHCPKINPGKTAVQLAAFLFGRQFPVGQFGVLVWEAGNGKCILKGSFRIPLRFPIAEILRDPLSRITAAGQFGSGHMGYGNLKHAPCV